MRVSNGNGLGDIWWTVKSSYFSILDNDTNVLEQICVTWSNAHPGSSRLFDTS